MKVAVIQGGPSLEAAVSRVSARAVMGALQQREHEASLFELGPDLAANLLTFRPDVVFPAVHGAQGEDGCLQGLLEILQLPYVGSTVRGSAVAASKVATKQVYRAAGLPVAREQVLTAKDQARDGAELLASLRSQLGPRVILKPASGGSALGIVRLLESASCHDLVEGLASILAIDEVILAEEYVTGIELTCGVLERKGIARALPPTLISAEAADWYDFKSKYSAGGSRHHCPAPIDPAITRAIQEAVVEAHQSLWLRDLSRTDVILREDGTFILLETNTLPGMTDVSNFPEAAAVDGVDFPQLIEDLIRIAQLRGASQGRPEAPMP
jgi:D-alanine-D-alanine ligase